MQSTAKIPGDLVHTGWALSSASGGARVCSAGCLVVLLLQLLRVTGLLIGRLRRRAELVPASSTRRSDGSSVLAPVFFRLRLARPQGSVQDASLPPLSGRGVWRCRQYEPDIEGRRRPKTI